MDGFGLTCLIAFEAAFVKFGLRTDETAKVEIVSDFGIKVA